MPKQHAPIEIEVVPDHVDPSKLPVEHVAPAQTNKDLELQLIQSFMSQDAQNKARYQREVGPQPVSERPVRMPLLERRAAPVQPSLAVQADELIERARQHASERKKVMNKAVAETDDKVIAAAGLLIKKFASLSSEWNSKLDALRLERHLSDEQMCFSLMAYGLDSGNHMQIPVDHPYFAEHFEPSGTSYTCVICDKPGERAYPGQPPIHIVSDERCSLRFNQLTESQKKELLEAAAA